jgi:ribonuclease P protein component
LLQQSAPNNKIIKKTLKRRSDFLKTYKGKRVRAKHLVIYLRPNETEFHRIGVTVPKAVGSAVVRNRYKRWCREILRKEGFEKLARPLDFNIFIGNQKVKKEEFEKAQFVHFQKELSLALKQAILLFC